MPNNDYTLDRNYLASISFTMRADIEGGYVNDPDDPGGETKYGISKRAYPKLDIKNLTPEQAKKIYFFDYWKASGADKLEWPLCVCHFDAAVNHGVFRSTVFLQKSGNDWHTYNGYRRSFFVSLNKPKYINGWLERINKLEKYIAVTKNPTEG